jgi:hypothetical protein
MLLCLGLYGNDPRPIKVNPVYYSGLFISLESSPVFDKNRLHHCDTAIFNSPTAELKTYISNFCP